MARLRVAGWGWGVLAAWGLPALVVVALCHGWLVVPDRWNPWAPLWPREPPNALTAWKLQRLAADPLACAQSLRATTLSFVPVPDRTVVAGCGWHDAVRVSALPARVGAPFVLTCPAAVALALWERHTVQPAALATFGARVVAVEQFGSYACRDIVGGRSHAGEGGERRSEHATANALDVAGFVLADGTAATVVRDWHHGGDDDPRRRFLRAAHDGACAVWNVVLGPDYNAAHHDHFHLDLGAMRACR